jgi:hypothetical protein
MSALEKPFALSRFPFPKQPGENAVQADAQDKAYYEVQGEVGMGHAVSDDAVIAQSSHRQIGNQAHHISSETHLQVAHGTLFAPVLKHCV